MMNIKPPNIPCEKCGGDNDSWFRVCLKCREEESAEAKGLSAGNAGYTEIAEVTEPEKLVLQHIKLPLSIDQMSRYIFDANSNMIAETRGWGWIQYKKDAELIQDTLGEMIVKAFNKVYGS